MFKNPHPGAVIKKAVKPGSLTASTHQKLGGS